MRNYKRLRFRDGMVLALPILVSMRIGLIPLSLAQEITRTESFHDQSNLDTRVQQQSLVPSSSLLDFFGIKRGVSAETATKIIKRITNARYNDEKSDVNLKIFDGGVLYGQSVARIALLFFNNQFYLGTMSFPPQVNSGILWQQLLVELIKDHGEPNKKFEEALTAL